jgi:hypothetical protein
MHARIRWTLPFDFGIIIRFIFMYKHIFKKLEHIG